MNLRSIPTPYLIAGAAVAVLLVIVATRGLKGTGQTIGRGAVDLADGVVSGSVTGLGGLLGIPDTNRTECARAKAEGRTWDASFLCPAKDFLTYLWE
jgi:hypothetical protein